MQNLPILIPLWQIKQLLTIMVLRNCPITMCRCKTILPPTMDKCTLILARFALVLRKWTGLWKLCYFRTGNVGSSPTLIGRYYAFNRLPITVIRLNLESAIFFFPFVTRNQILYFLSRTLLDRLWITMPPLNSWNLMLQQTIFGLNLPLLHFLLQLLFLILRPHPYRHHKINTSHIVTNVSQPLPVFAIRRSIN